MLGYSGIYHLARINFSAGTCYLETGSLELYWKHPMSPECRLFFKFAFLTTLLISAFLYELSTLNIYKNK